MATVLLGICDEVIPNDNAVDWSESKIGGKPKWMRPGMDHPRCPLCGRHQPLVTQLYSPLMASPYHRTLYVFVCVESQCWNKSESWCVFRHQRSQAFDTVQNHPSDSVVMKTEAPLDTVGMATADWCQDADDWDDDEGDCIASVAMATATEPITMATDDVDIITDVCSSDGEAGRQSHSMDDNSAVESVGSSVSRSDASDSMETTPGGEKVTGLRSAELRLQRMQLEDSKGKEYGITGNGCAGRGASNVVVDNAPSLVTDSALSRLDDPKLVPGAHTGAAHDSAWCGVCEKVVTLSYPEFVSRYVTVIEEPEKESTQLKHERHLLAEYGIKEGVDLDALSGMNHGETTGRGRRGKSACGGGGEGYEKGVARHGDQVFQKFTKRVSLCPSQLLRYSYGGSGLYISKPRSPVTIPPCPACGSERVFELQLMPALVTLLSQDIPVEFGAVLVYTCGMSCWEDETGSVREEYVYVQPDPDQHLFE